MNTKHTKNNSNSPQTNANIINITPNPKKLKPKSFSEWLEYLKLRQINNNNQNL